ncbi:MAG TPA: hypothetical protein VFL93_10930, partial [Longimicrobiaceae bacterium]|nr:hypothetical protein [Longimicrobiaceae bacterium]
MANGSGSEAAGMGPPAHGRRSESAPGALAWAAGWVCILALGAWLAQLSVLWLGVAAAAALVWSAAGARRGRRWAIALALVLWGAIGVGAGVRYRLDAVAHEWPAVQDRVESRAADRLNTALDALVGRGERAVTAAGEAVGSRAPLAPSRELFDRLAGIRSRERVSALAVFGADGSPLVWAGEHRGAVPLAVRRGRERYGFHAGPLFSYVYFTRSLP